LISKKCAERDGLDPQHFIDKWDLNAKISADLGGAIHKGVQYYINYGEVPKQIHISNVVEEFARLHEGKKLYSEVVVANDEKLLAGTIDVVESVEEGVVNLEDIKTNYTDIEKKNGKLLKPYDDIPDTKLNRYRLQLSLYKWILEQRGKIVNELSLYLWTGSEFNIINVEPIPLWTDS
jgi:ATP-dependent exoDNAse (exonuclease V) beta subunit